MDMQRTELTNGVPIEMNVEYGLFYNREDAAAAGVPDGPKTFDDVMKIAKNSAKFNGDVQEYGGLEFYNGDNFAALFLSWIMQMVEIFGMRIRQSLF